MYSACTRLGNWQEEAAAAEERLARLQASRSAESGSSSAQSRHAATGRLVAACAADAPLTAPAEDGLLRFGATVALRNRSSCAVLAAVCNTAVPDPRSDRAACAVALAARSTHVHHSGCVAARSRFVLERCGAAHFDPAAARALTALHHPPAQRSAPQRGRGGALLLQVSA
jgi:hypothetical protein